MDAEELAHKQALIKEHTRTLRELELQAARYGEFDVPIYIRKQIRSTTAQIEALRAEIGIKPSPRMTRADLFNRPRLSIDTPPLEDDLPELRPRRTRADINALQQQMRPVFPLAEPMPLPYRIFAKPWFLGMILAILLILFVMMSSPDDQRLKNWFTPISTPTITIPNQ